MHNKRVRRLAVLVLLGLSVLSGVAGQSIIRHVETVLPAGHTLVGNSNPPMPSGIVSIGPR